MCLKLTKTEKRVGHEADWQDIYYQVRGKFGGHADEESRTKMIWFPIHAGSL